MVHFDSFSSRCKSWTNGGRRHLTWSRDSWERSTGSLGGFFTWNFPALFLSLSNWIRWCSYESHLISFLSFPNDKLDSIRHIETIVWRFLKTSKAVQVLHKDPCQILRDTLQDSFTATCDQFDKFLLLKDSWGFPGGGGGEEGSSSIHQGLIGDS